MNKNKIITMLAVSAAVFSLLACFLIYKYLAPSRATIYVFNDSYTAGKQLTADMLTSIQVDGTIVLSGRKGDVKDAFVTPEMYRSIVSSGDSLRMDVSEGMPLTPAMLSIAGGSSVEMNMQSNAIAVTIPVDEYSGINNDLKEGSRVNIYCSMADATYLLQQNKRILEGYKNDGQISGVSVEANIDESMQLVYATTFGSIYLGLIDATGYQASEEKNLRYPAAVEVNFDNSEEYEEEVPAGWQEYLDSLSEDTSVEAQEDTGSSANEEDEASENETDISADSGSEAETEAKTADTAAAAEEQQSSGVFVPSMNP